MWPVMAQQSRNMVSVFTSHGLEMMSRDSCFPPLINEALLNTCKKGGRLNLRTRSLR